MGERIVGKFGHGTACFLNDVVGCSLAFRNHVAGEVRDGQKEIADLIFGRSEGGGDRFLFFFDRCDGFLDRGGFLFFALFHQGADLCSEAIEFSGFVVVVELEAFALVVERDYASDHLFSVETFDGEAFDHAFGVIFDLLECKHILMNGFCRGG